MGSDFLDGEDDKTAKGGTKRVDQDIKRLSGAARNKKLMKFIGASIEGAK